MGIYGTGGPPRGGDKGGSKKKLQDVVSDAMKGYSRYASEGKGLSDSGQRAYNAKKRASIGSGPGSGYKKYLFDVESMLVPGTNQLKGMYQLPGSPEFAGGPGKVPFISEMLSSGVIRTSVGDYGGAGPTTIGNRVASQPGGLGWLRRGSGMGLPPGKEQNDTRGLLAMGGLAYIVLKVLL